MKYLLVAVGVVVIGAVLFVTFAAPTPTAPTSSEPTIEWRFTEAPEVDSIPYTKVTVVINGTDYEAGTFTGSCSEVKENGGIDGKGLLAGELSAVQCWFAGGGNEVGAFAHEDGGIEVMVGELGEGEEGAGVFRGNFTIVHTVRF